MLNGKAITGTTLLELCEAYTKAINGGSVPCIESAWTYLCKNECQRAYQSALDHYSEKMALADASDLSKLKSFHQQTRSEAVSMFKEKALGDSIAEFEH